MIIKHITVTLSILILFSSISFAADEYPAIKKKSKKQYDQNNAASDPCESTSGLGQWECAQKKMEIADKKLNAIYKVLIAKLPEVYGPEGRNPKKDLIEAQRVWIKYRDSNCQFVGGISGGAPVWRDAYYEQCRVEMTEARTKELQKYNEEFN
jgi:uncharacterized protein YecT (DUF1311 family)